MLLTHIIKTQAESALLQAYPLQATEAACSLIEITEATQEKFGHYQLNSAMKLTKILGENPRQISEKWVSALNTLRDTPTLFAKIEIAGPGFINFTLHAQFLSRVINAQLKDKRLGVPLPIVPKKVVIDFSSPNIAKEMHIGHLRSTIIGDCLARILEFMGHMVLRLNHVGDWGTQFGMLIAHLKSTFPANLVESTDLDLGDFVSLYRTAKKRFDEDPEFKKEAQLEVVALQGGNEHSLRAWQHICTLSRKTNQMIYDLLDVKLIERGESYYNPLLLPLIQELESNGLLTLSDGAKCIYLEGFTNREGEPLPLILQKKDGGFNYATTDMAALRERVQKEQGNWLIYVTDAGQSLHFQMLFEAAKKAHFYDPATVRIDHVPFGLVLKADGKKFQTRSGETERLIDVLHIGIAEAKAKLKEHNPSISAAELESSGTILGINAIKYADLSNHRLSDYIFSYEKMLKFEGNTAAFILYAYVRIRSIQRRTAIDISNLIRQNGSIVLEEPTEIALGLLACQFNEILERTAEELLPNRLTDYLYRLAEKFHVFFHFCRVEGSPQQDSRLLLCEAVANVLEQGIRLLGLKPLDRM